MNEHAVYDDNPLASMILDVMILMGEKVKTNSIQNLIKLKISEHLRTNLVNPHQLVYLDFNIKFDKFGDKCEIKPNNAITALWFCGIFPIDAESVMATNRYYFDDGSNSHYRYYEKTQKLKFFN